MVLICYARLDAGNNNMFHIIAGYEFNLVSDRRENKDGIVRVLFEGATMHRAYQICFYQC